MNANFARLWEQAMARISGELSRALPPLIVALAILAAAYLLARLVHWVLLRTFRGRSFDRFLRQSGLGSFLWRPGRWRAAQLVAGTVQAALLVGGALAALSVFDTSITTRMVDAVLLMLPKLLIASGLLLAGAWLSQFLARATLVWAVNEGFPYPRHWATGVRVVVFGLAVVAASDILNFAREAMLGTYLLLLFGLVLALSLAAGLGARDLLRRHLQSQSRPGEEKRESLWNHL
jgi:hypothetical protein